MTANPIPGLVLPSINSPLISDPNVSNALQAIQTWGKSVSPRAFFAGTPLVGANPPQPPSDSYLVGWDNPEVTFSSGVAPVLFPQSFPNGIMYISVGNPAGSTTANVFSFNNATLDGFDVYSSIGGTGGGQITYEAVGW